MINRKTKILITGGSSGIGFHLVKKLLKDNYYIINLSRKKTDIKSKNLINIKCDLSNLKNLSLIEKFQYLTYYIFLTLTQIDKSIIYCLKILI